jgi:hypothetical protein
VLSSLPRAQFQLRRTFQAVHEPLAGDFRLGRETLTSSHHCRRCGLLVHNQAGNQTFNAYKYRLGGMFNGVAVTFATRASTAVKVKPKASIQHRPIMTRARFARSVLRDRIDKKNSTLTVTDKSTRIFFGFWPLTWCCCAYTTIDLLQLEWRCYHAPIGT